MNDDQELLDYARAKLGQMQSTDTTLGFFLRACLYADQPDFALLREPLRAMRNRYPLAPQPLND